MLIEKEEITITSLKNKFTGYSDKQRMLVAIFQQHNKRVASLVPKMYAPATLERYTTSLSHTIKFLNWNYGMSDINIRDIDHEFITDYDYFLRAVCNCSNNTTIKYIKNFRKIVLICIANGWLTTDPFARYEAKLKIVERVFLTEEELEVILNKKFSISRLENVKNIFLFCCFTGLAYSEVKSLNAQSIVIGSDGKKWLFIHRMKTGMPSSVPLLPAALQILGKYEQHPICLEQDRLLPVLSNQKMNSYLKEIADLCGIVKQLTFHTARHTFATTVTLNNDIPIESVSKMLGHKSMQATQHYAKISDKKVGRDMQDLHLKFK